jgi:capsular exopolysaccharide synthesis family protein
MKDLERAFGEQGGGGEGNARLFQTQWRGKWVIALFPLLFGAGVHFYLKGLPPLWKGITSEWQATAKVIVGYRDVNPMGGGAEQPGTKPTSLLNQQRALLKSEPFLRRMAADPEFAEMQHFKRSKLPMLAVLNESLTIGLNQKEDIVLVNFQSPFKREAVAIVDKIVQTFLDYHREKKSSDMKQIIDLLNADRDAKFKELEAIKDRVSEIKRANPELITISQTGEGNLLAGKIEEANKALIDATSDVRRAKTNLEIVEEKKDDPEAFQDFGRQNYDRTKDPILQTQLDTFISLLEKAEEELTKARTTYGEESARFKDLDAQVQRYQQKIAEIYSEFANAAMTDARHELRMAEALRDKHSEAIDQLREDALDLEGALDDLRHQEQLRTAVATEIEGLKKRINELDLAAATGALNLNVIDWARPSPEPVFPDRRKHYGIALALGLALGMGSVLLRGRMDRRIWTVEEVPDLLGTSVLAVFPRLPGGRRRARVGRIVEEDQGSLAAEAIRSVRTATTFGLPENGKGVVLVTSSVAGEGKSVTASNLALALAQADRRTILVDCDLRKPNQNEIFNVVGKRGVGDVLMGACTLNKAIIKNVAKGLDILAAGDSGGKAAELVEGPACRELIAHLRDQYDCVVLDSSPILETSEARVLAAIADLVIFVLRLDVSSRPNAVRAHDMLKGVEAKILGVMLNGSRLGRDAKAYAGGIAYGQAYGKAYGSRPEDSQSRVASAKERADGLEAWS